MASALQMLGAVMESDVKQLHAQTLAAVQAQLEEAVAMALTP